MKIDNKSNTNDKKTTKKRKRKRENSKYFNCLLRVEFSHLLYMAMFIFLQKN